MSHAFRFAAEVPLRRPGIGRAIVLHASLALRRGVRLRPAALALSFAALVAALVVASASLAPADAIATLEALGQLGIGAVAMVALAFGTSALRRDADHGALDAFMLRPRAELALPLGRWVAVVAIAAAFAAALLAFSAVGALGYARPIPLDRLPIVVVALAAAAMAYAAVFVAIGGAVKSAAVAGLLWWLFIDLGLAQFSETIALFAVRPTVLSLLRIDPDVLFDGDNALRAATDLGRLALLSAGAMAALLWRLRGDVPR